jgi:hypothetical protein
MILADVSPSATIAAVHFGMAWMAQIIKALPLIEWAIVT